MDDLEAAIYHMELLYVWTSTKDHLSGKDCAKAAEWVGETLDVLRKIDAQRKEAAKEE